VGKDLTEINRTEKDGKEMMMYKMIRKIMKMKMIKEDQAHQEGRLCKMEKTIQIKMDKMVQDRMEKMVQDKMEKMDQKIWENSIRQENNKMIHNKMRKKVIQEAIQITLPTMMLKVKQL
jgi:hypothetical protein